MPWDPNMRVCDARDRLKRAMLNSWRRRQVVPTRDQLIGDGVPATVIDLLFRPVMIEIMRDQVDQVVAQ
jgi:hypothetical protein